MPKFEDMLKGDKLFDDQEVEAIAKEDVVSDKEREAFGEMQRREELNKGDIPDNPEAIERIEAMVETLPDKEKEVIRQYYFQGKTFKEIGKDLGIDEEVVKNKVSRALENFRQPEKLKLLLGMEYMRDRRRYFYLLGLINSMNPISDSRLRNNDKMSGSLVRIGGAMEHLYKNNYCKLDSISLNEIFDEVYAIISKKGFDSKDVEDLRNIAERLRQLKTQSAEKPLYRQILRGSIEEENY